MTCPAPDRLDAYLDGEPDAAVRRHVDECPTCAAEVALARQIDAALAEAGTVRAPDGLVAAALAEARGTRPARWPVRPSQAADRATARRSRRGPLLTASALALAVVVVVATTWATREAPRPTADRPLVTDVSTPPGVPVDIPTEAAKPDTEPGPEDSDEPLAPLAAPANRPVPSDPGPAPTAPRPTAEPDPVVEPAATPEPEPIAQAEDAEPTPAEVEQAADDLRLAFALVADAQRRAGRALRNEAGPVVSTIDHALPF